MSNPVVRGVTRSEISKRTWSKRKREGGKGTCAFCEKSIFAGGITYKGRKYHKTCLAAKKAGLTKKQIGVNPRARRAWQVIPGVQEMNPRPPAEWWTRMMARVKAEYPKASKKKLQQIVGGIWWGQYPAGTREALITRYDTAVANPKRKSRARRSSGTSGILKIAVVAGIAWFGWKQWQSWKETQASEQG